MSVILKSSLDSGAKWRVRVAEFSLLITTIVIICLAGELAFALVGLQFVPLGLQRYVPADVRLFVQSSKAGIEPLDPVILVGDSYAQGSGDWLTGANPNRNGPFHSAHVIHDLTGRDVVTLGKGGSGSVQGMAAVPAVALGNATHGLFLHLPSPKVVVAYFYEGNDLTDNLSFLERYGEPPPLADDVAQIDRKIADYSAAYPRPSRRHLPFLDFCINMARSIFIDETSSETEDRRKKESAPSNMIEVGGRPILLPGSAQAPSPQLTDAEMRRAVLVFERSLAFLRGHLPSTPVMVVYIPSTLSSYRLLSPRVSAQTNVRNDPRSRPHASYYPKERVAENDNLICVLIRAATIDQGAGFLDLRPAVRAAGAYKLLHGPHDFGHFNRNGMEVLGQEVAKRLDRPLAQDSCLNL